MGETPYTLAFSVEAWILIVSNLVSLRMFNPTELAQSLDELEEKRERVGIQMAEYQRRAARHVERLVNPKAFIKGELVLRWTFEEGKLKPNWEGPYIIADE